MSLGDFFPENMRKEFAKSNVNLGTTILIRVASFSANYPKYVILIANTADEVASIAINSEINLNVNWTKELVDQHVLVPLADHTSFLTDDSHADCNKIIEWKLNVILDFIANNPSKVFNVTDAVCKEIVSKITYSKTITKVQKRKYGFI